MKEPLIKEFFFIGSGCLDFIFIHLWELSDKMMMIALFGMPRERLVAVWEARPRDRVPNWPYRMERAVRNVASLQDPLPPSWRPSPTNWRSTNEQIEVITRSDAL